MIKREQIRLNKAKGLPYPWSDDPILNEWKFTNVWREHDKTSQKLIEMFYSKQGQSAPLEVILLNCATFRYFGTWEFAEALGWQKVFSPDRIIYLAKQRLKNKQRVFTGAYIITNQGIKAPKEEVVVNMFLSPLWASTNNIILAMEKSDYCWRTTHEELSKVPGFGGSGFMAKETLLDTMHCNFWNTKDARPSDYWKWTPIGPGARRGINRIMGNDVNANVPEKDRLGIILKITEEQDKYWPKDWYPLSPSEIQFQLCEMSKYCKVVYNEGRPRSKYIPKVI